MLPYSSIINKFSHFHSFQVLPIQHFLKWAAAYILIYRFFQIKDFYPVCFFTTISFFFVLMFWPFDIHKLMICLI